MFKISGFWDVADKSTKLCTSILFTSTYEVISVKGTTSEKFEASAKKSQEILVMLQIKAPKLCT